MYNYTNPCLAVFKDEFNARGKVDHGSNTLIANFGQDVHTIPQALQHSGGLWWTPVSAQGRWEWKTITYNDLVFK